jgi:hypothetical protein
VSEPGLDRLLSALTAEASPEELAGRDAALAAFRESGRRRAAGRAGRWRRGLRLPGPVPRLLPFRLAVITAAVVIAVAGVAAAAYNRVLPGPVQDAAHSVFAPLGVPDNHGPGGQQQPGVPAGTAVPPSPAAVTTTSGPPTGRTARGLRLTLAASRTRAAPGSVVVFSGRVSTGGRAVAGTRVYLVERLAGTTAWQVVASGVSGAQGGFRVVSPPLTRTAVYRAAEPGGTHSAAVRVNVTARAAGGAAAPAPTG